MFVSVTSNLPWFSRSEFTGSSGQCAGKYFSLNRIYAQYQRQRTARVAAVEICVFPAEIIICIQ